MVIATATVAVATEIRTPKGVLTGEYVREARQFAVVRGVERVERVVLAARSSGLVPCLTHAGDVAVSCYR